MDTPDTARYLFRDRRSDDRLRIIAPFRGGLRQERPVGITNILDGPFLLCNVTRQSGNLPEIWFEVFPISMG